MQSHRNALMSRREFFTAPGAVVTIATAMLVAAISVSAGTWGQGNWGQMYWGTNPETAPVAPPVVSSITDDASELVVVIDDYPVGTGADGWLRATSFEITCVNGSSQSVAMTSAGVVRIPNLEPNTEYQCTVQAFNELGGSPGSIRLATTGALLGGGLPISLLSAAACKGPNPPSSCPSS
ncbi:MAG: hypothetical protein AAFY29_11585 [Pseudomonadota bacterium]